jgi:hypothetical protein
MSKEPSQPMWIKTDKALVCGQRSHLNLVLLHARPLQGLPIPLAASIPIHKGFWEISFRSVLMMLQRGSEAGNNLCVRRKERICIAHSSINLDCAEQTDYR